jgi:hypothetical protein
LEEVLHKANNHLAVIWGYVQLLERREYQDPLVKEWLEKVSEECRKLRTYLGKKGE